MKTVITNISIVISLYLLSFNVYPIDHTCYQYKTYAEEKECERRNQQERMQREQLDIQRKQLEIQKNDSDALKRKLNTRNTEKQSYGSPGGVIDNLRNDKRFLELNSRDKGLAVALIDGMDKFVNAKQSPKNCIDFNKIREEAGLKESIGLAEQSSSELIKEITMVASMFHGAMEDLSEKLGCSNSSNRK